MYKLTNVLLFKEIRGCLNARNEVRPSSSLHLFCKILFLL